MDDRDPAVQRYSPKQNKLYSYQAAINTIAHDPASRSPHSGGKNMFEMTWPVAERSSTAGLAAVEFAAESQPQARAAVA